MAFSTLVSYSAGLVLLRSDDARIRRMALVVPISVDLALLATAAAAWLLLALAVGTLPAANLETVPADRLVLEIRH